MADVHHPEGRAIQLQHQQYPQHQSGAPGSYQVVKTATAAAMGGSLLVLSGLTLAGTVIALTVATPLLVIFSPVLVPALISVFLLVTGFLTSGGLGIAAATVLFWMYRYVTGDKQYPRAAESWEQPPQKWGWKGRETRDRERGEHATAGGH